MMNAAETVAFDLGEESAETKARFGDDPFGTGCLMARRLVEAGVPFVEVAMRGWDTHFDHGTRIAKQGQLLDQGMSALLADLKKRGLLDSTLVVWAGRVSDPRNPKRPLDCQDDDKRPGVVIDIASSSGVVYPRRRSQSGKLTGFRPLRVRVAPAKALPSP